MGADDLKLIVEVERIVHGASSAAQAIADIRAVLSEGNADSLRAALLAELRAKIEALPGLNHPRNPEHPSEAGADWHHWKAWDEIVALLSPSSDDEA